MAKTEPRNPQIALGAAVGAGACSAAATLLARFYEKLQQEKHRNNQSCCGEKSKYWLIQHGSILKFWSGYHAISSRPNEERCLSAWICSLHQASESPSPLLAFCR